MRCGLGLALLLAAHAGCSDDPLPATHGPSIVLGPIPSFDSELWRGTVAATDPVIARVEGTAITRTMLEREVVLAGAGADPRAILERMIELELLAREAFAAGRYTPEVVGDEVQRALARRLLARDYTHGLTHADVPHETVAAAYDFFRSRYDHYEAFHVVDAQILCCTDENPDACYRDLFDTVEERRRHHADCFRDLKPVWQTLRERTLTASDRAEFRQRAESVLLSEPAPELRETYRVEPKLHEYSFEYDVQISYEEQFKKIRYQVLYEPVMEGVKLAWLAAGKKTPYLTEVIQSPIGYHLIYVDKVMARRHDTVDAPVVQAELRGRVFDDFRTRRFREDTDRLCKAAACETYPDRLVPLQESL